MGTLNRFRLDAIVAAGARELFETGTGEGESAYHAAGYGLSVTSVETSKELYDANIKKLGATPNLNLLLGDSDDFLRSIPSKASAPRIFWLDAHFYGGADYLDGLNTLHNREISLQHPKSFPLQQELEILLEKDLTHDWVIIDDARLYVSGAFGKGACPESVQQFSRMDTLKPVLERFLPTHLLHLSRQDEGYFVLVPKSAGIDAESLVKVFATDLPGDPPGVIQWHEGVIGCTSISIARRIRDHRFATRYFKGYGLDVGCGIDSLARYSEFFPLIQNITTYDRPQGDAQKLVNVANNSFDFIYSSHCLEHLRDAREALQNWIRVVKPGGYLVVQVPDEDLYEQEFWPSRYNSDHKITFTIAKKKSWSPVSVNLLDLLSEFAEHVSILHLGLEDAGYQYRIRPYKFDQTRTPMAECAIEFVLQKRTPA